MKNIFLIIFLVTVSFCQAQPAPNAFELQETAKTSLKQGDYENAILLLNKALQMQPDNLEMTKDLLFAN